MTRDSVWSLRVCATCQQAQPERPDYYRLRVDTRAPGRPVTFAPVCKACERARKAGREARRRAGGAAKDTTPVTQVNTATRFDRVLAQMEQEVGPIATWRGAAGELLHGELSRRLRADAGLPPYPPLEPRHPGHAPHDSDDSLFDEDDA